MVDATRSSKGLAFVQLENGWIEVQPKSSAGEMLQNAFCEHLMTSGVWTAAFRILSGKDEKEGGIFLGIVPDGCSSVVPLGDRHAGIGWGKAKPYVVWNEAVARPCLSQRYPFHPEPMTVRMEQRHYTFQYAVGEVVGLLKTWGYGHYETNFRRANMDGLKLLNVPFLELAHHLGYAVRLLELDTPAEEAAARARTRDAGTASAEKEDPWSEKREAWVETHKERAPLTPVSSEQATALLHALAAPVAASLPISSLSCPSSL